MNSLTDNNKKLWDENIKKYDLIVPDENVVRFLRKVYRDKEKSELNILDFGCGSGRNSIFMAMEGFNVYAIDYNEDSVQETVKKVEALNGKIIGKQNQNTDIPFKSQSLDCAICWGSLFLNDEKKRIELLKELNRVLKQEGEFFANWRTTDDYFYAKGQKIENNLYLLDSSAAEYGLEGMLYYFATLEDLKTMYELCGFEIYNVEKREFTIDNMKVKNSHWHIWAKKK